MGLDGALHGVCGLFNYLETLAHLLEHRSKEICNEVSRFADLVFAFSRRYREDHLYLISG